MFLRCSYFLRNLSLNVLINRVLIKKMRVLLMILGLRLRFRMAEHAVKIFLRIPLAENGGHMKSFLYEMDQLPLGARDCLDLMRRGEGSILVSNGLTGEPSLISFISASPSPSPFSFSPKIFKKAAFEA